MKHTLLSTLLFITLFNLTALSQSLCFDPAADNRYQCNQWPRDIVAADFDEDGHLDVVTANNGGSADFLHGNGDGTFATAIPLIDASGDEIEMADFNIDGHMDIVRLSSNDGFITVNFGNGDGTFDPGIVVEAGIGANMYTEIALGYYDDDSYTDIAVNDFDNDRIVLIGNFNGTAFFVAPTIDTSNGPCNLASGDLNNDGFDDLVVAYAGIDEIDMIINNNGNSSTTNTFTGVTFVGNDLMEIEIFDIDNQNGLDVVVHGMAVSDVFTSNGNNTYTHTSAGLGSYAYGSVLGDWNDDGLTEYAVANESGGGITVKLNSSGSIPGPVSYYSANEEPVELCAGDFNEDGDLDIVTANDNGGTISFVIGHGDGTFGSKSLLTGNGGNGVAAGDFDEDGDIDIAGMNTYFSAFSVSLNNNDGTYSETQNYSVLGQAHQVAVADFDEDGHLDLVTHSSEGFTIFAGDGNGSFSLLNTVASASVGSGGNRTIVVDDFNNDNHADIAGTYLNNDQLAVTFGDGSGGFSNSIVLAAGDYPRYLTSGDANNDGRADIALVSNEANQAFVFISNNNNTFQSPQTLSTGSSPQGICFVETNGDNFPELAVAGSNSNNLIIYGNNNGSFSFSAEYQLPPNTNAGGMSSADFNQDGNDDLIIAFNQSNNVGILFGSNNGTFQPVVTFGAEQSPDLVITDYFNDDTSIDIAVLNTETNNISVILNNAAFISASGPTAICEGETVVLTASEGYTYEWSNGETTQSIEVGEDGSFSCIIGNQSGDCDLLTTSITVTVEEVVNVTWAGDIGEFCLNSEPYALGGGQPMGGEYSGTGVSNGVFDPAAAGMGQHTLTYTYESAGNCFNGTTTTTVEVLDVLNVELNLTSNNPCLGVNYVFGGGSPTGGVYLINGTEYTSIFTTDLGSGDYTVLYQFSVSQNCFGSATQVLTIDNCIGVNENDLNAIEVFPTITESVLNFSGEGVNAFTITDQYGRIVMNISGKQIKQANVESLASGAYFISFNTDNELYRTRFIKQ
jgi:hypothetical protein